MGPNVEPFQNGGHLKLARVNWARPGSKSVKKHFLFQTLLYPLVAPALIPNARRGNLIKLVK